MSNTFPGWKSSSTLSCSLNSAEDEQCSDDVSPEFEPDLAPETAATTLDCLGCLL